MNTTDSDRLLLEYLDGTASPGERARTEAWLAANPGARARRAQLEALFSELASLAPAGPPADLRERVLDQIRTRGPEAAGRAAPRESRAVANTRASADRTSFFGRRPILAAGLAFAAGLAVGVLALGGFRGGQGLGPTDPSQVMGAMGGAQRETGETASTRLEGARIAGRAFAAAGVCRAEIEIELPEGFTAELSDPAGLRLPAAVRRLGDSAGAVRVERDRVVWAGAASGGFQVEFAWPAGPPAALRMSLLSPAGSSKVELPVNVSTRR